jgi:uncharacterized membrane protein
MKLIPIHPQGDLFNLSAVARAVTSTLIEATGDARSDLQKTTASWKHKVDFAISPIEGGFQVDTGDKIWKYVDEGTRAHIITPKHGKVLSFGPGSRPKTAVRVIGSTAGAAGGAKVVAHRVNHPGTDAREFTETVQEKWNAELPKRISAALGSVLGGS